MHLYNFHYTDGETEGQRVQELAPELSGPADFNLYQSDTAHCSFFLFSKKLFIVGNFNSIKLHIKVERDSPPYFNNDNLTANLKKKSLFPLTSTPISEVITYISLHLSLFQMLSFVLLVFQFKNYQSNTYIGLKN